MSKDKYILQVMGMNSSKYGGLEQYMILLAEELKESNIRLILMYNSYPWSKKFIKHLYDLKAKLVITDTSKPFKLLISLIHIFIKYRPVIVHSHFGPFYPVLFSTLCGMKNRLVMYHLMITRNNYQRVSSSSELNAFTRIKGRIVNVCSTKILTVAEAVGKQYQIIYPESASKLKTIYLGAFPNHYDRNIIRAGLGFSNEIVYIACIAFATKFKGIDVFLRALRILKEVKGISKFKVCIIGLHESKPLTIELQQLADSYGLKDIIIWYGIKDNVPEMLAAMDIYCQPSWTEALPLALCEAGMAGLPCIGSNVGGVPETILHNQTGFVFEAGDSLQLANYLKEMCLNTQLRHEFGVKAKGHMMRNFHLTKQAGKMALFYHDILNGSPRSQVSQ